MSEISPLDLRARECACRFSDHDEFFAAMQETYSGAKDANNYLIRMSRGRGSDRTEWALQLLIERGMVREQRIDNMSFEDINGLLIDYGDFLFEQSPELFSLLLDEMHERNHFSYFIEQKYSGRFRIGDPELMRLYQRRFPAEWADILCAIRQSRIDFTDGINAKILERFKRILGIPDADLSTMSFENINTIINETQTLLRQCIMDRIRESMLSEGALYSVLVR